VHLWFNEFHAKGRKAGAIKEKRQRLEMFSRLTFVVSQLTYHYYMPVKKILFYQLLLFVGHVMHVGNGTTGRIVEVLE
jgi:hypothetical protein